MTTIESDTEYEVEPINVRRQSDYSADDWQRLLDEWQQAGINHGPGYCAQPMTCSICMLNWYAAVC